ncbi:hypothetical protein Tco_0979515 [Tanacetum coccineum]
MGALSGFFKYTEIKLVMVFKLQFCEILIHQNDTVKKGKTNGLGVVKEEKSEESVVVDEGVHVVSGEVWLRHAPNYSVVNAILEKKEDGSGPRCGHTLTSVAAVGEEGSTRYMGVEIDFVW